jgi:hypothetical protein
VLHRLSKASLLIGSTALIKRIGLVGQETFRESPARQAYGGKFSR